MTTPVAAEKQPMRSSTGRPLCVLLSCMLFLAAPCSLFCSFPEAAAMDVIAELSAGYNNNTLRTNKERGSAFALYSLTGTRRFGLGEGWALDALLTATYQDYERVDDNYLLQGSLALSYPLASGRVLPSLLVEATAFRDDLIEEDDRNELTVGLLVSWVISPRLSLNLKHSLRWMDYRNWATPFAVRGQGRAPPPPEAGSPFTGPGPESFLRDRVYGNIRSPGSSAEVDLVTRLRPRDDRLEHTGLDLDIFLPFSLTCSLHAGYSWLHSSLRIESYKQVYAGAGLCWQPADRWMVELDGSLYRTRYHKAPGEFRQTNYTYSAALQLRRFWGRLELYGQVMWLENDSSLAFENYTQMVTQCGFSWSF